ncbi:Crp/Fnr family transcriptional regulator [Falsiroseomonas bella]|uniref:Crp/Fnr family transcriptional regulator n=1 Tax=Falsiroseomonas bella TaxID=2184016 RepID=A0A317FNR8_9PROT|nr:Crp/Fnr family transcriptional regulator [Falsiroseomonas bella]PWS39118.1 Crp/Fnr family transcriptional regulator [Falsiroseomonas bella]
MDTAFLQILPPGRLRRLVRGEALFRVGDAALGLVVVEEGALELLRTSPEGRRLLLHRAGPGETFAEASLFEPQHHCDAIAAAPSLVRVHAAVDLRHAASADPELGWRLAAHLAGRLVAARARIVRLALPHAADRLLDALHALPAEPDGSRRPAVPWKSLAAELGLSHEATYRALARLQRMGALRREGRDRVRLPPFPRG